MKSKEKLHEDIKNKAMIVNLLEQITPNENEVIPDQVLIAVLDALETRKRAEADSDYFSTDSLKTWLYRSISRMDSDQVQRAYRFIRRMLN